MLSVSTLRPWLGAGSVVWGVLRNTVLPHLGTTARNRRVRELDAAKRVGLGLSLVKRWLAWGPWLVAVACSHPPAPLFDSRVPYEPLQKKLAASGGDASRILRPRRAGDLDALASGKSYKYVVGPAGAIAIAPLPADAPGNEYVHPILAAGGPVRTAGNLRVTREGPRLVGIAVDQGSKAYCPTGASLQAALEALARIGVPADSLRVENRPPLCAGEKPPDEGARYGALMAEVGSRFERMGRAELARRYELAEFERGELEEVFEEDLPRAEPPRESAGVDLAGVAQAFQQTNLPELKASLAARDPAAFREAFSKAALTCNGCHRASGHPFVEVPTGPGLAIPRLDPVPSGSFTSPPGSPRE